MKQLKYKYELLYLILQRNNIHTQLNTVFITYAIIIPNH